MRIRILQVVLVGIVAALPAWGAQQGQQPSKPNEVQIKPSSNYDPYPAEKDVEVGIFYMHKGDLDAAVDRFLDAIALRPNYAKPRLLLGEIYEKKGEKESAVKYYKEYLQVYPSAPDGKKIQKKIDKLSQEK
jgi:tetratricopeptide (TPR) repeat protein